MWPGSDVVMTLRSPSGRVITRGTTAPDVEHHVGPTYENFVLTDPEPGEWKVELYGEDVAAGGEEVRFEAQQFERVTRAPVALFDLDRKSGEAPLRVALDAARTFDPDAQALTFAWKFGDGGTAAGARAEHVFAAPGTYEVELTVTDADGLTSTRVETVTVTAPASGGGNGGGGGGNGGGGGGTVNPGTPPPPGGGPAGGGGTGTGQPPATRALGKLVLPKSVKRTVFTRRGLKGTLEVLAASADVRAKVTVSVGRRKLATQTVRLGRLAKGRRSVRIKPSRALLRALGKRRGATLAVEITVVGQSSVRATVKLRG
jgi:PKD repeat protein